MSKTRTLYVCQNCGRQSPRLMGKCPSCGQFNTMVEEIQEVTKPGKMERRPSPMIRAEPQRLTEIGGDVGERLYVPVEEFNRVLGGGIVPGSIILLGGDPGIGKCVVEGTLVPTERGLIPIEQLKPAESVEGFSKQVVGVQSLDGLRYTSHFYDSGVKPTIQIQTRMGYKLKGTYVHPVLTLSTNGQKCWKKLQDIEKGDYVAIQRHGAVWGNIVCLPQLDVKPQRSDAKQPKLPKTLTPDFAYILGVMVGDGCMLQKNYVNFTTNDYEIVDAFERWCKSIGLELDKPKTDTRGNRYDYRINSITLKRWLQGLGLKAVKSYQKEVPYIVMQSTQENIRAFLSGLFDTDGSAYFGKSNSGNVDFCSTSEKLARQVHLLLLQFGIVGKLRFKPNLYVGSWIIHLQGNNARLFYEKVGFRLIRKQAGRSLLPANANGNLDVIPYIPELEVTRMPGNRGANAMHRSHLRRYVSGVRHMSYEKMKGYLNIYPELQTYVDEHYFWDRIETVDTSGEEHCYDLTVPVTHAFVTNGIVSHNSTILLQISALLAQEVGIVLYVSGEESARQIKMRADRMNVTADDLFLLTETNLSSIFEQVNRLDPAILVIDSIQTTYMEEIESSPGSVTQVRECASRLQHLAKSSGISVFLVGHVTKEGNIAGPRVLEHIVDTVLYLEGDPFQAFRLLRSVKNRFGATSEVGVFEMGGDGMTEVPNPSEAFLAERVVNAPGSAIAITMEGTRPLLVELQALTSPTSFGNPRRTPNGVDMNRLLLISAVLSKRVGLKLHEQDIFVNVIGGLKVNEPASDLAMAVAMASSYFDKAIPADLAIVGEVGLSGELRAVGQLPARLNEAAKMGFKRALIPKLRKKLDGIPPSLKVIEARNLGEALGVAVPRE